MPIDRINRITDYRIFKDYEWPSDLPDFARLNLIYGWNGSGKTTLSSLFNSLQQHSPITSGDVRFVINGTELRGSEITTSNVPNVRVFNRDTVHRTIYEAPHQEFPPVYYLGEESADKQRRVVELKESVEGKNSEFQQVTSKLTEQTRILDKLCTEQAANIKNLLTTPGGGPYNNFNKSNFRQKAASLSAMTPPPSPLTAEEREHYLETQSGKPMDKISEIAIPSIDYTKVTKRVDALLKKTVVTSVLDELLQDPRVASWVQTGVVLHKGEHTSSECRFCKQPLPTNRLEILEAHFSDELSKFQHELDQEIAEIGRYKSNLERYQMPDARIFYPHLLEEYERAVSGWPTAQTAVSNFLDALVAALKKKRDEPFTKIDLKDFMFVLAHADKDSHWLLMVLGAVLDVSQNTLAVLGLNTVDKINKIIKSHNQYTTDFAKQVEEAKDQLAQNLVIESIKDFQANSSKIEEFKQKARGLEDEIEKSCSEINQLEIDIRQHRKAADELNTEMSAYLGRDELRFEPSENGYRITRNGLPARHLSEGERTAVSFMYFLKTLEDEDFDISNGIVVIDDPISSLDSNSLYSAFSFMKERTKEVGQLFVLTHSFSFFKLVRGWFMKQPGMKKQNTDRHSSRFYQLDGCTKDRVRSARLCSVDPLLRDYESEYHFLFKKVYDEAKRPATSEDLEAYYGLPNVGRRLLETFLTFKLPHFEAGRLEKKMNDIEYDPAKKTRILRFLHVYSHYDQIGAPEHDLSVLSETPSILADLMELIKTLDPEHYAGMQSLITPTAEESV